MSHALPGRQQGRHSAGRAAFVPRQPLERRLLRVVPVGVLVAATATTSALALGAQLSGVDSAEGAGGTTLSTPSSPAVAVPAVPREAVVLSPAAFDAPRATAGSAAATRTGTASRPTTVPKHRGSGPAVSTPSQHKPTAKHSAASTPAPTSATTTASASTASTPAPGSSATTPAVAPDGGLLSSLVGGLLGR